ncbi:MAG: putative Ig domain-containing protein [Blastocatellia bacterium]
MGDGKAYAKIGAVPWESLQAGDTVLIYWRAAAYKEKWIINRQGQPNAPITVRGVPGPNGELPIIDGNGATTRTALNYWNESRGLIKIGGSSIPADMMPQYIVVENLDVRSARSPYTFISSKGNVENYTDNAAAILLEKGDNITIRNCVLSDSGNGLFASSSDTVLSRNVLVDGCYIHSNGIVDSPYQHNVYTEAQGITFQNNRLGPLRAGAQGSNLKDRSSGLIVRYNWIEGGNREMDLVDAGGCAVILGDPRYHEAFVYGNILIEPDGDGNRQIVHYGGDSANTADYRKGTLYFYENTVISKRTDRTTYFRISTNDERCDARNNIFYTVAGGDTQSFLDNTGTVQLSRNWVKPGWVVSFNNPPAGSVVNDGTSILGTSPGFVNEAGQDYRLAAGSAAINAGGALSPAAMLANDVTRQYRKHQASEARAKDQSLDLGAYEQGTATTPTPAPIQLTISTTAFPNGTSGVAYAATLTASGGTAPYVWRLVAGALPAGLSLNAQTGAISGTPTGSGTASFTVQLTDAQPTPGIVTQSLTITIAPASTPATTGLQITTTALASGRVGVSYSQPLVVGGGRGTYYWAVVAGYLPTGLTLNSATGTISGIPQQAGTKGIAIRVWDLQSGLQTTRDFSLTIAP